MTPDGAAFSPEPIQNIVEKLANTISRSVAVDDGDLRLLAHSHHFGDEDPARIQSLVGRSVTAERSEWARRVGVMRATAPLFTPSDPELGLRPRYVAPVRVDRELAAIIWIIDDGTLTSDDLAAVDKAVEDMRTVLIRRSMTVEDDLRQTEALVLGLLADRVADREDVVDEMENAGIFRACTAYVVIDLHIIGEGSARTVPTLSTRILQRALTPRCSALAAARTDEGVVVIVGFAHPPAEDQLEAVERAITTVGDEIEGTTIIGIGSTVAALAEVHVSHEQAEIAIRIARTRGVGSCTWVRAELDGLLAALLPQTMPAHLVPRRIATALAEQTEENILAVKTYLAHGGNVVQTGAALHLHRTTVYYRLSRFSETTGFDLDDGDTRLLLHLWFRMQPFVTIDAS